ncbi:hypothetical protein KCP75_16260 [Salmonella enterica subsp. enterica]|nr:hypothetical protein KCP75_16260 [Salmonella enterica subsp. enterica]
MPKSKASKVSLIRRAPQRRMVRISMPLFCRFRQRSAMRFEQNIEIGEARVCRALSSNSVRWPLSQRGVAQRDPQRTSEGCC